MFLRTPKALDAIDMTPFIGKLVLAVFDPGMLLEPKINKAAVSSPAIRMDDAFQADSTSIKALRVERLLSGTISV